MDTQDFSEGKPGKIVRTAGGYLAFVPDPLPPKLDLAWSLVHKLSEADRGLAELAGIARNLPNPHLLISPFLRREAVLSSRIEGTQASLSDLFFFEADYRTEKKIPDVREVQNYVRALEYGLARLGEFPLSLRLIREMHEILMDGVRGSQLTPGECEFRRSQNWIGPSGCSLMDARFVPPPTTELHGVLTDFEEFLHAESTLPALIRLGLIHYQFEAIHPFLDGNGRIGRLLISLLFCHYQLLPQPLLYLSAYFEQDQQEYYDRLLAVSKRARWSEWVEFFLRGVAEQSRDAIKLTGKLLDLREEYREKLAEARSSALLLRLVDGLFEYPVLTIPRTAERLGVTQRAANLNIRKLVGAAIVREVPGRSRYKLFVADEIIQVLEVPKRFEE